MSTTKPLAPDQGFELGSNTMCIVWLPVRLRLVGEMPLLCTLDIGLFVRAVSAEVQTRNTRRWHGLRFLAVRAVLESRTLRLVDPKHPRAHVAACRTRVPAMSHVRQGFTPGPGI